MSQRPDSMHEKTCQVQVSVIQSLAKKGLNKYLSSPGGEKWLALLVVKVPVLRNGKIFTRGHIFSDTKQLSLAVIDDKMAVELCI